MRLPIGNQPTLFSLPTSNNVSRRLLQFPEIYRSTPKPWICQQCYHQRTTNAKDRQLRNSSTANSQLPRNSTPLKRPSFFQRRLLSYSPENEQPNQRSDLPSQEENRRSHLSKRFSHIMDHLQSNIFIAGQRLNDLTGYSGIEALKKDIEQQGSF